MSCSVVLVSQHDDEIFSYLTAVASLFYKGKCRADDNDAGFGVEKNV